MPKLPSTDSLGVRSFQDRSSIVTPRVDTSGQNALVSTISNISNRTNERLDASSLHKAKMSFQKAKLEADSAFDQDDDFETYQQRYDDKIKSAIESSSKMVRNPADRAALGETLSLYRAQGNQVMIAKAFSKEVDKGRADLTETLTMGRENYLRASTKQDKEFAIATSSEAIDAAEKATHIDADQAQKMRQNLAVDLAIASVESSPPEKQLSLLKSREGVIDSIPYDVRDKMIKNAETQLGAKISLETANTIRESGGDLSARMKEVNKIKDPKIKSAVRSQVISDFNVEEKAEAKDRFDVFDEADKILINGGKLAEFVSEKPAEWDRLTSDQQRELIKRSQGSTAARKTDPAFYHELNTVYAEDPEAANLLFMKEAHKLSDGDFKSWSNRLSKPREEDPLYSLDKEFNLEIGKSGLNLSKSDAYEASQRIREEWEVFQHNNPGKKLNVKQQKEIINDVIGTHSEGWLGKTYNFEITRDQVQDKKMKEKKAKFGKILSDYRDQLQGESDIPVLDFTDYEISLIYRDSVNKGLIDE